MLQFALAMLAACWWVFGCVPVTPPNIVTPLDAIGTCSDACSHLRSIGCPDGDPTPNHSTCETVCETDRLEPAAQLTDRYLACLASIVACSDEERCQR